MATFKLRANELSGETGLTVQLYPLGGSIANSGGDTLTESSGLFSATVSESLTGVHDYYIYQNSLPIYRGLVNCSGSVWIADQPETLTAVVSGAVSLVDETEEDDVLFFFNQSPVIKVFLTDDDLTGQSFDFVIEKEDKTSIVEVTSISGADGSVSVTIPSVAAQTDKCFSWSLRYSSTNTVYKSGPAIYRYAPIKA